MDSFDQLRARYHRTLENLENEQDAQRRVLYEVEEAGSLNEWLRGSLCELVASFREDCPPQDLWRLDRIEDEARYAYMDTITRLDEASAQARAEILGIDRRIEEAHGEWGRACRALDEGAEKGGR